MLNRLKITFWMIKNGYYLHLIYSIIFFLNKTFNKEIRFYERFSFKEAENLCKNNLINHKDLYLSLSKKKHIKLKKYLLYQTKKRIKN